MRLSYLPQSHESLDDRIDDRLQLIPTKHPSRVLPFDLFLFETGGLLLKKKMKSRLIITVPILILPLCIYQLSQLATRDVAFLVNEPLDVGLVVPGNGSELLSNELLFCRAVAEDEVVAGYVFVEDLVLFTPVEGSALAEGELAAHSNK
jgi:hypothetical protein